MPPQCVSVCAGWWLQHERLFNRFCVAHASGETLGVVLVARLHLWFMFVLLSCFLSISPVLHIRVETFYVFLYNIFGWKLWDIIAIIFGLLAPERLIHVTICGVGIFIVMTTIIVTLLSRYEKQTETNVKNCFFFWFSQIGRISLGKGPATFYAIRIIPNSLLSNPIPTRFYIFFIMNTWILISIEKWRLWTRQP